MRGPIAILGTTSFLGARVFEMFSQRHPDLEVRGWASYKTKTSDKMGFFVGDEEIKKCLDGVTLVINCHEARDLSLYPNNDALEKHNQQFVAMVRKANQCHFVHISTVLVQCSNFWPNTYEPERDTSNYSSQWPCKAYCHSKHLAEQAAFAANGNAIILRIPFLYGEEDTGSIITDAIIFSDYFSSTIPDVGDHGGAFQMAHVSNVASDIELVAKKLIEGDFKQKEIMILGDDTPIGDPYSSVIKPYATNSKRQLSSINFPFLPIYYLYILVAWSLLLVNRTVNISHWLIKLPDPSLFYLVFHHWTLFNTKKASFLLPERACYSRQTINGLSRAFYSRMDPSEFEPSWMLTIGNK